MEILPEETDSIYFDALQEVSNIGLGNAATALSDLLNRRVDISVPQAKFMALEEVMNLFDDLGEVAACISLAMEGDINGSIIYIFTQKSIFTLIDMLMGQEIGTTSELDFMGESAAMEIGNIMSGSFMNAIGAMTGLLLNATVPMFAYDMLGAVFSSSILASGQYSERIMVIETVFYPKEAPIKGHFFLLPEVDSLDRLFEALGLPVETNQLDKEGE